MKHLNGLDYSTVSNSERICLKLDGFERKFDWKIGFSQGDLKDMVITFAANKYSDINRTYITDIGFKEVYSIFKPYLVTYFTIHYKSTNYIGNPVEYVMNDFNNYISEWVNEKYPNLWDEDSSLTDG